MAEIKEPVYQPVAQCPSCKKLYNVKSEHIAETCPVCFKTLKMLKKKDWTIKYYIKRSV